MANKNKAPKKAPAAPAASKTEEKNNQQQPATEQPVLPAEVANKFSRMSNGLDPNHQVELLGILNDRFFKDPEAAKNTGFPEEQIQVINEITACGAACILAEEVVHGNSAFAMRMRPSQLEHITSVCNAMGINIKAAALPAPDENGTVLLPATAVEVSEETAEQVKKEDAVRAAEAIADPTKITNDEELIAALNKIMVTEPNTYKKIAYAINFYEAYLKFVASKSENKDEELAKIEKMSRIDMLKAIAKLIGACPLVLSGVGRFMYTVTATTKSPISAFCSFRNTTKNKKTGAYALTDQEIADYVRALVEWTTDLKREAEKQKIADAEANLEVLKKDEKKNAKGIEEVTEKIATLKGNMEHFDCVLEYITSPSSEVPVTLIEKYEAHEPDANRIYKALADSYYDDVELKEMKLDGVKRNIGLYAGIVTNLFRAPSAQLEGYHLSDIQPLEPIVDTTSEESEEDGSKKE